MKTYCVYMKRNPALFNYRTGDPIQSTFSPYFQADTPAAAIRKAEAECPGWHGVCADVLKEKQGSPAS